MKSLFFLIYIFVLSLFFGCVKNKDLYHPPANLTLSTKRLEIGFNEENVSFTIKSNYPWTISLSSTALKANTLSGSKGEEATVLLTVAENNEEDRNFAVTVKSDREEQTLNIRQLGKNLAKTASDINISKFDLLPDHNENIHIPISYFKDGQFLGDQQINYYQADLSGLVASWQSNAVKVMVEEAVQVSGETKNNFLKPINFKFFAKDNSYKEIQIKIRNAEKPSSLPLLILTTDDNKDITSKEIWSKGKFKLDPQGHTSIHSSAGVTEIRGRGNSTWGFPKKPYALKLQDKAVGPFMGMNAHKRWVLLANYADKTSLRNRIAFELGKKAGLAWTPDSKYVEVILNGRFLGNYLLTEQIKIDAKRIAIEEVDNKESNPERITGGWLLEVDRYYSNGETRYFRPAISQLPIIVKEPEDANDLQMNYINDYFNQLEKVIYPSWPKNTQFYQENAELAGIPDSSEYGKLIDINSFINYWIVQELTENRDSRLPGSVYLYKGINKKLCIGPLWDFDQTTFLGSQSWLHADYIPTSSEYTTLEYRALYYKQLFRDPKFRKKVKERWETLYGAFLNGTPAFIDQELAKISESLDQNWIDVGEAETMGIWGLTASEKSNGGRNHDKNLKSSEAILRLKKYFLQRLNWMDTQIRKW